MNGLILPITPPRNRKPRIVDIPWKNVATSTMLDRYEYGFDRASNRLWRRNAVAAAGSGGWDEYYQYDGLYQLKELTRGTLASLPGTSIWEEDFTFDSLGNWPTYVSKAPGTTTLNQTREYNLANEITEIDNSTSRAGYDPAGNVIKRRGFGGRSFTKSVYNGVGWNTSSYVACDPDPEDYEQAGDVSDDLVLQQVDTTFDDAGNAIFTATAERNHDATGTGRLNGPNGASPQARISYMAHYPDALGRQVATANYGTNGGTAPTRDETIPGSSSTCLVNLTHYNKRGENETSTDPEGTVLKQGYNDAERLIKTIENYQESGSGPDINKTTEYGLNGDGQVTTLTIRNDVTGDQVTHWNYGTTLSDSAVASYGLLRSKVLPDSTGSSDQITYSYDRQGAVTQMQDQNGTIHDYRRDKRGRFLHDLVTTLGTNIDARVRRLSQTYDVRGLLETISSYNSASSTGTLLDQVRRSYNDFGQVATEYQEHNGAVDIALSPRVTYQYADGSDNTVRQTGITYPNGRVVTYAYGSAGSIDDLADRITAISDIGGTIASYTRRGAGDPAITQYPTPGLEMTLLLQGSEPVGSGGDQYNGLDRFNRLVDVRWRKSGADVDRYEYGFDWASNRLWRRNAVAAAGSGGWDEHYGYDGLYQLKELQRGNLTTDRSAISGTPVWEEDFTFDPTGNWSNYTTRNTAGPTLNQDRTHNAANEITAISHTVPTPPTPQPTVTGYDPAGNMTLMPKVGAWDTAQSLKWDAWNRLVEIKEGTATVGEYAYDGLFRRLRKTSIEAGVSTQRDFYYSVAWQVLEEQVGGSAERQFLWGTQGIDDLVRRDRQLSSSSPEHLYATRDRWHVTGVFDASGSPVERYAYQAFGEPIVLSPTWAVRSASLYTWETRFDSYRWDEESDLYQVRYRYLHSGLGRWVSCDPITEADDVNVYVFLANSPTNYVDMFGLKKLKLSYDASGDSDYKNWINVAPWVDAKVTSFAEIAEDAEKQVRKYHPEGKNPCDCIEKLVIIAHGFSGFIESPTETESIQAWDEGASPEIKQEQFNKTEGVHKLMEVAKLMCKDGEVTFTSCWAGQDALLKKQLESALGVPVRLYKGSGGVYCGMPFEYKNDPKNNKPPTMKDFKAR